MSKVYEKYGGSTLGFKEIGKYVTAMQSCLVQCKRCGRKKPIVLGHDKTLCDWCNNYIYKDEITEFKDRLLEAKRREEKK